MGIVNPTMLEVYDDIPKDLLEHVEDVLLDRRDDATERLLDFAEKVKGNKKESDNGIQQWRTQDLQERITHALVKGIDAFIIEDVKEKVEDVKVSQVFPSYSDSPIQDQKIIEETWFNEK